MAEKNEDIEKDNQQEKGEAESRCGECGSVKVIGYCHDCEEPICEECQDYHKKIKITKGHRITRYQRLNTACPAHLKSPLNNYCETCERLICGACTAEHKNHTYALVEQIYPKHSAMIAAALKPIKEGLIDTEKTLQDLKAKQEENAERIIELENEVDNEIDHLKEQLDELRIKRKSEFKKLFRQNKKCLGEHQKRLEKTQTKLSTCVKEAEKKLQSLESIVLEKSSLMKDIEQASIDRSIQTIRADIAWGIELHVDDKQIQNVYEEALKIIERGNPEFDIDCSYIAEDDVINAVVSDRRTVVFHALTKQKKECEANLVLHAQLVHVLSNDLGECKITKKPKGQYDIDCTAVQRGIHRLHVTVNAIPIQGSPFSITVSPSPHSLTKPIKVIEDLHGVRRAKVNSKGQIIAIEGNGSSVSVLTPEGKKIQTFGTHGSEKGQLRDAWGVAVDKDDNIYITGTTDRIQKFNTNGEFVKVAGSGGNGSGFFCNPYSIFYNHKTENLYVVDSSNHRIQVFSADHMNLIKVIGKEGSGSGNFKYPHDIAFDDANNMYIADTENNCIQVLSIEGQFLRAFTQKAKGEKLKKPWAIAIDSCNTVYVSEQELHCVSVFSSHGAYITTFGGQGSDVGKFNFIFGLSINNTDNLLVADRDNHRLQIF